MSSTPLQELFQFKCLLKNIDVKLTCRIENGVKQLLAVITNDGDIVLHYTYGEVPSVIRRIPWFTDSNKVVQAVCFDPTATWLLVAALDGSLYIIPALSLVDKKQKVDCKWSINDITYFSKHSQTPDSKPCSIVWWQTLDSNQNALIGHQSGVISLISLTDGRCLGTCSVNEVVTKLYVCQDNSLDSVFLLINGESGQQWRLILEQHSTGYLWPPETNVNPVDETTRSRLYSLKQMSVDKLASLKQRLSEARGSRRDSQTSDTTSESSHSESSGPELLPHLCDTFFAPQYARNRYLFSAFYKPSSLLTIHAVDVESAPLYVHKLLLKTNILLLTDRLIYTIDEGFRFVSIISSQLSECRLEGDSEFNPEALLAQFNVQNENERILCIYKVTDVTSSRDRRTREHSRREKERMYNLPKCIEDLNLRKPKLDTCLIVTTSAVYRIVLRCSPVNKFINLVTEECDLEKAERLAVIFGLNLQNLLESCGDLLIGRGSFHQGLLLYKQAKVHLLKRVLKLAVSGDCKALLKFVNLCLSASKVDMSVATKIHMGNLAVMAYTELILRHDGNFRITNTRDFMQFLCYEEFYDQVLAVNVACQAGHWNIVALLSKARGLQREVVMALTHLLQTCRAPSVNNLDFLVTLSEPSLIQSLLINPLSCQVIMNFVRTNVNMLPVNILERLSVQLDPSQPAALPFVSRLFQKFSHSTSLESTHDSADYETPDEIVVIVKEIIETFIFVLIKIIEKSGNYSYDINLLDHIDAPDVPMELPNMKKFPEIHPLNCGYEHAALVRNGFVYTMGVNSSGCLGLGPLLTQSSPPKLVQTLADLRVRVLSVSCGKKHTLALTDFGIYAWGSNIYGQLGLGPSVQESPYPQIVSTLCYVRVVDAVAGQYHSLALSSSGQVYTWGWGIHGQLGHGNCDSKYYPQLLDFEHPVKQIAAGHAHSLVLAADGKLYGFGSNAFGQLESCNLESNKTTTPVWVFVLPDIYAPIEKVATAYFHNIIVRADQEVYTWGASPQEVRLSQSKYNQKLNGLGSKAFEPWKSSVHVYSSTEQKPVEQVAVGFRHSAVLHNGRLLWGKNMDVELSPPKTNEQELGVFNQRFSCISCGPDYTMALDQSGKLLAWGNSTMAQTILGRQQEDDARRSDGKIVIFKNTKRIVRIPHNSQSNADMFPLEVPGLPTMAITFNPPDLRSVFARTVVPYSVRSLENKGTAETKAAPSNSPFLNIQAIPNLKFGPKTLHYVLESYFGYYDAESVLSKCLEANNYQAASKISILDHHFSDSLGFQLTAFKKYIDAFDLDLSPNNLVPKAKKIAVAKENCVNEGRFGRIQSDSPAHILSSSSSLDSIQQWSDDLEHQGGCESPCDELEIGDIRQSMSKYLQFIKNENSPPISSVSKLISDKSSNNFKNDESGDAVEVDVNVKDTRTREIIRAATYLIEFYIEKTYASENHILMQNILMKCIEFYLSIDLPVCILENVLLKNMEKYFYPLSILLFCKNFNNNLGEDEEIGKNRKSVGFLKEFSTKFCLQLCSMVLENVNKA